jgi:hypothetical protein
MSSNHQKTPVTFSFTKEKETQRFTLHIKVGKGLIVSSYAVHGAIQREIGTVLLNEITTLIEPETTFTEPFQALVLRVASLYTGYPLRKFVLTDKMITTWFDRATTNVGNDVLDMPSVNVEETLRLDRVASEIYEVTCEGMYAVLTHDPEEVEFREEWMDATTQMMLNAVFEIPKMWTSNINASGMVVRDSQTEWVWNYSPVGETLLINVHDRVKRKFAQWEVTKEKALEIVDGNREAATHYRCFMNADGTRSWLTTRKVVVQRAFIDVQPAATTRGVFGQIRHVLEQLQRFTLVEVDHPTEVVIPFPAFRVGQMITVDGLKQTWSDAYGELPVETTADLANAYMELVAYRDKFEDVGNWRAASQHSHTEVSGYLMTVYRLLNPRMMDFVIRPDYLRHFDSVLGQDQRKLWDFAMDDTYRFRPELRSQCARLVEAHTEFEKQRILKLEGKFRGN